MPMLFSFDFVSIVFTNRSVLNSRFGAVSSFARTLLSTALVGSFALTRPCQCLVSGCHLVSLMERCLNKAEDYTYNRHPCTIFALSLIIGLCTALLSCLALLALAWLVSALC